ncbi:penicillin-binding protein 1C [Candidatus Gracilibacteria bacterium]|nr:penicillin-binding protein 1C [Candidatus Gracilibacteria bacterium]
MTVAKKLLLVMTTSFVITTAIILAAQDHTSNNGEITINDRNGKQLMRLSTDSERQRSVSLEEIPRRIILGTLVAEDQRFFTHHGIDSLALLRAGKDAILAGKVVSGASTISQQVARNILGINRDRTYINKIEEIIVSIIIEKLSTKATIITYYLNQAFYGNNSYGIEQAAQTYFQTPLANLDWNQITLLVALPQNANYLNPYTNINAVRKRQITIAEQLHKKHLINREELASITAAPPTLAAPQSTIIAPHFSYAVIATLEEQYGQDFWHQHQVVVTTTLDRDLYQQQKAVISHELEKIADKNVHNAASIMIDNQTGNIMSYIGNQDYFDTAHQGAVDMVQAKRQPGSALKPFIYLGTILFKGLGTGSIFYDVPTQFQTSQDTPYTPLNYDLEYHGPVTMREALANSYNIPAVQALEKIGSNQGLSLLQRFGISSLTETSDHYGLSLALGSGEVSLLELTNAYRGLANQGTVSSTNMITSVVIDGKETSLPRQQTIEPVFTTPQLKAAITMITDILSDNQARLAEYGENNVLDFGKKIAAKTGTSRNFHDNWTVGYSKHYTVGVWVGNSDGSAMQQISGIAGAGPIFHGIMVGHNLQALPPNDMSLITPLTICLPSGLLPTQYCNHRSQELFLTGQQPTTPDTWYQKDGLHLPSELSFWQQRFTTKAQPGLQIIKPHHGDDFQLDAEIPLVSQSIPCQIAANQVSDLRVMLNGKLISTTTACALPLDPGQYQLTVTGVVAQKRVERSITYTVHR